MAAADSPAMAAVPIGPTECRRRRLAARKAKAPTERSAVEYACSSPRTGFWADAQSRFLVPHLSWDRVGGQQIRKNGGRKRERIYLFIRHPSSLPARLFSCAAASTRSGVVKPSVNVP